MESIRKALEWACEVIVKIVNDNIDKVHYPTYLVHGREIKQVINAVRFLDEISFLTDDEREEYIDDMSREVSAGLTRIITYAIEHGKVKVLESITALSIHIPIDEYFLRIALVSGHPSIIRFLIGTAKSSVAAHVINEECRRLGNKVCLEVKREVNKWAHHHPNKRVLNVRR